MRRSCSLRLLAGLLLALGAALSPLSARAGPESLFTGCTAQPFGAEGWSYECGDFRAALSDHAGLSEKRLWESSRRLFKGQAAGAVTFKAQWAKLAGRKVRLLRIRPKGPEARESSVFAVLPVKGRGARRVLCTARGPTEQRALCGRVLEQLAGRPWQSPPEEGVAVAQAEAALAGRELSTPTGCELTADGGSGRLQCADGSRLDWAYLPEHSGLRARVREGVETFKDVPKTSWMESRLPCAIDGAATECTYLRGLDASERREVYFAGTVVRGLPVFVSCVAGGPSRLVPRACQQVLSFR